MRFALAFVAILVVSWTCGGEAFQTGAKKSVKEVASAYENSQNGGALSNGAKTVSIDGVENSVKDLVKVYESYTKEVEKSPEAERLPTPEEVEKALQNGKEREIANSICGAQSDLEYEIMHWWNELCNGANRF